MPAKRRDRRRGPRRVRGGATIAAPAAAAAASTPPDIGLTAHWWAGDGTISDGVAVSSWAAYHGTGTVSQGTGTKQPVGFEDGSGRMAVRCDGSDDQLNYDPADQAQVWSAFVVFKLSELPSVSGVNNWVVGLGTSADSQGLLVDTDDDIVVSAANGTYLDTGINAADTSTLYALVLVGNGASSKWRVNANTGTGNAGAGSIKKVFAGSRVNDTSFHDGDIYEFGWGAGDVTGHANYADWLTWLGDEYGIAT